MIVRIGFIGVGFMGQVAHLDNFLRVPECEVKAICDVRPKLLEAVAFKYQIPSVYEDYHELLADPELDAVVCSQPPANTYPVARDVLAAGKHLLTQSPMATRKEDGEELVELARRGDRIYGIGCMKRYDLGVERAKEELLRLFESGEMGLLLRVDAHNYGGDWMAEIRPPIDFPDEPPPPDPEARLPDFLDPAWGEAYLEYLKIYTHNINLIRFFMPAGELKPMDALISFRRGILSHNTSFTLGNVPVSLRGTSSLSHEWQEETRFTFEKGWLAVRTPSPLLMQASAKVQVYRSDGHTGSLKEIDSPPLWSFMRQAAGFIGSLAGVGAFRATGGDCLADLAHVENIFRRAVFIGGHKGGAA